MAENLAATFVRVTKKIGKHPDGGNLYLQVSESKRRDNSVAITKSWLFRYSRMGKDTWIGLGAYPDVSLKSARELSSRERQKIRENIDPLSDKRARRWAATLADANTMTFAEGADAYIDTHSAAKRNPKHILTTKAVLQDNYLFRGLPEASIDKIASLSLRRAYDKGTIIFSQGDKGDALYGVASGRVRISTSRLDGREAFLNIMEPGDTFGEIAVVDGLPRTAAATALDANTTLVVIGRLNFLSILESEPQLTVYILKLFCDRVRWMSQFVEESVLLSGPARLAKRLLILASLHGRPVEGGGIEMQISQSELAQFLGISRQKVNQHLQEWRKNGWVELGRARISVRDPGALSRAADQASEAE